MNNLWGEACVCPIYLGAVCLPSLPRLLSQSPSFPRGCVSFPLLVLRCSGSLSFLSVDTAPYYPFPYTLPPSTLNSPLPVPPYPESNLGMVLPLTQMGRGRPGLWSYLLLCDARHAPDCGAWFSGCVVGRMTSFFLNSGEIINEKTSWKVWSAYINVSIYNDLNYLCSKNRWTESRVEPLWFRAVWLWGSESGSCSAWDAYQLW